MMKTFLGLLVLVLAGNTFALEDFKTWKEKYDKDYSVASARNESEAEKNFRENAEKVQKHNSDPDRTYEQKLNSQSDRNSKDMERSKGYRPDPVFRKRVRKITPQKLRATYNPDTPVFKNSRRATKAPSKATRRTKTTTKKTTTPPTTSTTTTKKTTTKKESSAALTLPKTFEHASTQVKNQGLCASCWAVSVSTQLEIYEMFASSSSQSQNFSHQNLLDCTKPGDYGCNGGDPGKALEYSIDRGITSGNEYKYTGTQGDCEHKKYENVYEPRNVEVCYGDLQGNHTMLQEIVYYGGPITIMLDTAGGFDRYSSGVYTSKDCSSDPKAGNHAVVLLGWGETPQGQKYWVVQNSWGQDWGMRGLGYIYVERGTNMCGIENVIFSICGKDKPLIPNN